MKKIYSIIAILAGFVFTASAADLGGKKFYLNPGHGGHDSDDRQIVLPFSEIPDFWESEGNLERGFHLRDFFEANNAKVKMSRVTNTSDDDLGLSTIASQSNSYGGYFISLHTNGANSKANYTVSFYKGTVTSNQQDSQEAISPSKEMGLKVAECHTENNLTEVTYSTPRSLSDYAFNGWNYGVLRTNNCPGYLVETWFHDYRGEALRLKSNTYNKILAWQILQATMLCPGGTGTFKGCIVGDIRDLTEPCGYTQYVSYGRDQYLAVNGAEVNLYDANNNLVQTFTTDDWHNGVFAFFELEAGTYTVEVKKQHYHTYTKTVTVQDCKSTGVRVDFEPIQYIKQNIESMDEVWNFTGNNSNMVRSIAKNGDKLYVLQCKSGAAPEIAILNAFTCAKVGNLSVEGIDANATVALSAIKVIEGGIIVGTNAVKAGETLRLYKWESETAAPVKIYEDATHASISLGGNFAFEGNLNKGGVWYTNADASALYYYKINRGKFASAPTAIPFKDANGAALTLGGEADGLGAAGISINEDADLWIDAQGSAPKKFSKDGTLLVAMNESATGKAGTSMCETAYGKMKYVIATAYKEGYTGGQFTLVDVTNDYTSATTNHGMFPAQGLGSHSNVEGATSILCELTDENFDLNVWVCINGQSVAHFIHKGRLYPSAIKEVIEEKVNIKAWKSNGALHVAGIETAVINVYSISGHLVASAKNSQEVQIDNLNKGIYIVSATDANGKQYVSKVML